ncbi:hypothetical protein Trichorick_01855 (plasmid) [Candidatus Trichorickettsia mobilis]|uniref:hypothetical protein n=1 Tax=Candidatus Trichorickettsia mobilis TaxID=1346319 RepID=UPI002B25B537|nr:hypothetical protein [Candidatus Trichorickettsia mobilis]WPY01931.1 hypothetical protein Trichorick_01855 [Candidatus Trichorickettsia mobilis]
MIRFRCDKESKLKQGNKTDSQDKVKNRLSEELILAIIVFSLSMNLKSSGYQDQVDQMFETIKAARTAKSISTSR